MTQTKKQSEQHIIDAEGERLFRAQLPSHWILRPYRPDYGLDFTLEIFARSKDRPTATQTYETLGEHIFIQLKSSRTVNVRPLKIYGRSNVEKAREHLDKKKLVGVLDTARILIETSELVTVERMGISVPVLLVLADLEKGKCYFVCLNDYIDKILVPRNRNYAIGGHRTVHLPVINSFEIHSFGHNALRWFGKRAKLYSAYQRFVYQATELNYALKTESFPSLARYFAAKIVNYDFWDDTEMWPILSHYGKAIQHFLTTGQPGIMRINERSISDATDGDYQHSQALIDELRRQEIIDLWRRLSVLPRNYEEVQRERYLPTEVGYLTSFSND